MNAREIGESPAHPWTELNGDGTHFHSHPGMTIRQAYKIAAMQVIGASPESPHGGLWDGPGNPNQKNIAKRCGEIADAMLQEDAEHAGRTE